MSLDLPANQASFTFQCAGAAGLGVLSFRGHEALSQPFHFDIEVASSSPLDSLEGMIGGSGVLTLLGLGGQRREIHGVISEAEHIGHHGDRALYRVSLVSNLFLLSLRRQSRIMQSMTTQQVIEKVMKDAGLTTEDYRFALTKSYTARDYCVQYRETDLAFVQRLIEHEGWLYFFEGDASGHKLVLTDDPIAHMPIGANMMSMPMALLGGAPDAIQVKTATGQTETSPCVHGLKRAQRVTPGSVTLGDFSFKQPAQAVQSSASGGRFSALKLVDFPGRFVEPGLAQRLANTRLQEAQTPAREVSGDSNVVLMVPGFTFRPMVGGSGLLGATVHLLTAVHHQGQQGGSLGAYGGGATHYNNFFTALPDPTAHPFRTPRLTPRPSISGLHTAKVVGPESSEIYTDEDGRIKVRFHWDRDEDREDGGQQPENRSCWIRVVQPWAGAGFGAVFVPRVGTEVVVQFLEGDPDRPVVTGCLYNRETPAPYGASQSNTQTAIRTRTSPEGDGKYNELRFEDQKDKEEIFLRAERDWLAQIRAASTESIGADWKVTVGKTWKVEVEEEVEIVCGETSIKLTKGGEVEIRGKEIRVESQGTIESVANGEHVIDGAVVKVNC